MYCVSVHVEGEGGGGGGGCVHRVKKEYGERGGGGDVV